MKSKSYFMYNFSQIDTFLYLILTLPKCTSFAVFEKDYYCFRPKNKLYWQPILKKLIHLRFWSDGAGFKTEAQKLFNARIMHTT